MKGNDMLINIVFKNVSLPKADMITYLIDQT